MTTRPLWPRAGGYDIRPIDRPQWRAIIPVARGAGRLRTNLTG